MKPLLTFATCVAFLTTGASADELPTAKPESVGMSSERLARIAPAMQAYIDQDLTPGVITAIMRKRQAGALPSAGRYGRRG